jgi:Icc-related predicted phosphoesterase
MKICATSDLHGYLPPIPECDIFLIAGDICPSYNHEIYFQEQWLRGNFSEWLRAVPARYKVYIAGNHDFYFEDQLKQRFGRQYRRDGIESETNPYYLEDSMCEIEGLKIYGSPWQLRFYDWAFNLDEPELSNVFDKIPKCDILVTHSPPFMCGDLVNDVPENEVFDHNKVYPKKNNGSKKLIEKIKEYKPALHVYGHIHSGYGIYMVDSTICANVSFVNERYQPVHKVMEFEI